MKQIKFTLIILLGTLSASFSQIKISSKVNSVIIFSNKAQITRIQNVSLQRGNNTVKFYGLESSINQNSIQVSGSNTISVMSFGLLNEQISKEDNSFTVRRLLDSLKVINKKETLTRNRITNLSEEKRMILSNKNVSGKEGFNIDNMLDLVDYYRNNLIKIDELVYDYNQSLQKIRIKKSLINKRIRELGYRNSAYTINVEVFSDKPQTVSMKLVYLVNSIGWTPFYELKSDGNGGNIQATCKAQVYQNSKVNWENVNVTLSTNNSLSFETKPEIHPWELRFQSEYVKNYRYSKRKGIAAPSYSNSSYETVEEVAYDSKSMANYTTATDNLINKEYKVAIPYSVSGQNGKAVVEIEKYELEAEYTYFTAPKVNDNVFLIAHISEWEKHDLLPGKANLYLKGSFVGTTMINPNELSDTMSLVLGKDKSIIVKREKIKDFTSRQFLGGNKKIQMGIQITVKNTKGIEVDIIVEDQVPISKDEKIVIDVKSVSKAKREEATGKLTWKYKLKAGESKIHKIKYEVKYPKNKKLSNF